MLEYDFKPILGKQICGLGWEKVKAFEKPLGEQNLLIYVREKFDELDLINHPTERTSSISRTAHCIYFYRCQVCVCSHCISQ